MLTTYNEFVLDIPNGRTRVNALRSQFAERFKTEPEVVVSAPGRTEIIGNHTDHNNGRVVAAAIQQDTLVVAGPVPQEQPQDALHLISHGWDREFLVDSRTDTDSEIHDTERLMLGLREGLQRHDLPVPGYRACMDSTVLPGSGLSSSAALEMALAGVHGALADTTIPPLGAALAGRYAENNYLHKPSGLMDQLASALGGMNALDFADSEAPRIHRIELDFDETNYQVMVVNTGGSHADLTDYYAAVSAEMHAVARELGVSHLAETGRKQLLAHLTSTRQATSDRAVLRAFHFFEEQERVSAFIDAADSRYILEILELMRESGDSSIRLLQNIHTGSPQDQALALGIELTRTYLRQRGAVGAYRVHGGGFAGTMLAVIPADLAGEYRTAMHRAFGDGSVIPLHIRQSGMSAARLPARDRDEQS